MLLEKLLGAVFQFREFKNKRDGDAIDRLNHQYSPALLVLLTIVISVKQYVGAPIDCWCPAQFTDSHVAYTNAICFVNSTYFSPFDEPMPGAFPGLEGERLKRRRTVSYYQWVPFVLLIQSVMFIAPHLIWKCASRRVGIDVSSIIETSQSYQKAMYVEARDQALRYVVTQVDGYLRRQRQVRNIAIGNDCCWRWKDCLAKHCCLYWGRFYGNHLLCVYVGVKLLYIANIAFQIFLLDRFLAMRNEYFVYGMTVLSGLLATSGGDYDPLQTYYDKHALLLDWPMSDRFPRVTLCDFHIRQQTNVHRYTVQCVLPINLFNEKVFLLIWLWLTFVGVATVLDIVYWTSKSAVLSMQLPYVRRQLRAAAIDVDRPDDSDVEDVDDDVNRKQSVGRFVVNYLRRDGILLVRLIGTNVSQLAAGQLLSALWNRHGGRNSDGDPSRPLARSWRRRRNKTISGARLKITRKQKTSNDVDDGTTTRESRMGARWLVLRRVFGRKNGEGSRTDDVTTNGDSFAACDVV